MAAGFLVVTLIALLVAALAYSVYENGWLETPDTDNMDAAVGLFVLLVALGFALLLYARSDHAGLSRWFGF